MNTDKIAALSEPMGVAAEGLRALRTHIIAQHLNQGRRGLAICAPSRGVGCTFMAVNLAVALSQVGLNTLLMDANLRTNSGVEKFLPPPQPGANGLLQALSSEELELSDCVQYSVLPSLSVLYSGGSAANAQELLSEERFAELMARCLRDFDITIVDTPAANICADARRISTLAGYSLVVSRKNKTLVNDVKTLVDELTVDHAQVIGAVLNEA